jgi:hypothetical protein
MKEAIEATRGQFVDEMADRELAQLVLRLMLELEALDGDLAMPELERALQEFFSRESTWKRLRLAIDPREAPRDAAGLARFLAVIQRTLVLQAGIRTRIRMRRVRRKAG